MFGMIANVESSHHIPPLGRKFTVHSQINCKTQCWPACESISLQALSLWRLGIDLQYYEMTQACNPNTREAEAGGHP